MSCWASRSRRAGKLSNSRFFAAVVSVSARRGHRPVADRDFQPHRSQLGRTELQPHRAAAGVDRLERLLDALDEPHAVGLGDDAGLRRAKRSGRLRRLARRPVGGPRRSDWARRSPRASPPRRRQSRWSSRLGRSSSTWNRPLRRRSRPSVPRRRRWTRLRPPAANSAARDWPPRKRCLLPTRRRLCPEADAASRFLPAALAPAGTIAAATAATAVVTAGELAEDGAEGRDVMDAVDCKIAVVCSDWPGTCVALLVECVWVVATESAGTSTAAVFAATPAPTTSCV